MCGLAEIFQYRAEALPGGCLAHCRIAIIHLSETWAQTMVNAQAGDRIDCNGGIYNHRGLRTDSRPGRSGTAAVVPHKAPHQRSESKTVMEHRCDISLPPIGLRGACVGL